MNEDKKVQFTVEQKRYIQEKLMGSEKMLLSVRDSLTKKNQDASLSNYLVYTRVFKLIGMVELASEMGINCDSFEWLWRLK